MSDWVDVSDDWEDVPEEKKPSIDTPLSPGVSKAFFDHAANGALLGGRSKLMGAIESPMGALKSAQKYTGYLPFIGEPAEDTDSDVKAYLKAKFADKAKLNESGENYPVASGSGEITGSLASGVLLPAGQATMMGRAAVGAGLGGTAGLIGSDANSPTEAAEDFGKGFVIGGLSQPAIEGTMKAVKPVAKWGLKKGLNVFADTPEKLTEGYLKNPESYKKAGTIRETGQKIADTFGDVRNDTGPAFEQAMSTLSKNRTQREGFEAEKVISLLKSVDDPQAKKLAMRLEDDLRQRAPGFGQEPRPAAIVRKAGPKNNDPLLEQVFKEKMGMQNRPIGSEKGFYEVSHPAELSFPEGGRLSGEYPGLPENVTATNNLYRLPEGNAEEPLMNRARASGYVPPREVVTTRVPEIPKTAPEAGFLTEAEMHEAKKALQDAADNWKSPLPTYETSRIRGESGNLNQILKEGNPDYQFAMDELSQNMRTKQGLASKFGIEPDYSGANESGFKATDRTEMALKKAARNSEGDRAQILEEVKNQGYGDLSDDIDKSLGKAYFEGQGTINGSRRAKMGASIGTGVGGFVGGLPGAVVGGGVGAVAGGAVDKYAPQIAKGVLDAAVIGKKLASSRMGQKFARVIQAAAQRGSGSLSATHFILSQTEPEYNAIIQGE